MSRSLLHIALLPSIMAAYVQLNYPINQQLPPVAYVNTPHQFRFAPTTFQSDSQTVQYSLVNSPSWLSIDSTSRTLSGTPRAGNVGEISISVAAAGAAGAVATMDSKLLVTIDEELDTKVNITQVLTKAGPLSGPTSVSIGSSKPFDISFPVDTFISNGKPLTYAATLSDHTPLPAWISFDASSMHFAGTAPSTGSAQTFEILLVACTTPGYAASTVSFTLVISSHQLLFRPFAQTITVGSGDDVHVTDTKSKLFLDGSPIDDKDLQAVNATVPSWLKFDNKTQALSGKVPSGIRSLDVTITAEDQSEDIAQLSTHFVFETDLFASELDQLNITLGEHFEYSVPRSSLTQDDEIVSLDFSTLSDYLRFDATKLLISGTVPHDFPPGEVSCSRTATSSDGTSKDTQTVAVRVSSASSSASVPAGKPDTTGLRPLYPVKNEWVS